jgi:hypothetical protein
MKSGLLPICDSVEMPAEPDRNVSTGLRHLPFEFSVATGLNME